MQAFWSFDDPAQMFAFDWLARSAIIEAWQISNHRLLAIATL